MPCCRSSGLCGLQDFRTVFSRNQVLGDERDDAVKRADTATEDAKESKQELMRQVWSGSSHGSFTPFVVCARNVEKGEG